MSHCVIPLILAALSAVTNEPVRARRFELTYVASVTVPPGAERLDLWLPYPRTDAHQQVRELSVSSSYPIERRREREYGNEILHLGVDGPPPGIIQVQMRFDVTRQEYVRRGFSATGDQVKVDSPELRRWLAPDRLVPLDDYVRRLATEVTRGKSSALDRARAIYDYTVNNLKYDKTGSGWGNGDIYYACDVKRGNCTDFHAIFIGFARSLGIPAKFAIGLPLPEKRGEGGIAGYHCWAEFYLPGYGWVPVDSSEANKNPDKREYFFGAHDENRIELSVGRDITLEPRQAAPPLNYFVYPYAELDGSPVRDVEKRLYFKDLPSGS